MTHVFVAEQIPEDSQRLLEESGLDVDYWEGPGDISAAELLARTAPADVLVSAVNVAVSDKVMTGAPKLGLIANIGDGFSNIDVEAAKARGIKVTNAPGHDSIVSTAEQTVALLLSLSRRVIPGDTMMKANDFKGWEVTGYVGGHQVAGKKLLIIGMGRVGSAVAQMMSGFKMTIRYVDPVEADRGFAAAHHLERVTLEEGLAWADYVTLNCALTADNEFMIDAPELALMQQNAYLVNCARGPLLREDALIAALKNRQIAGAALDVYQHEPHVSPELTTMENVVLTPHAGNATVEARHEMARTAVNNAIAFAAGRPLECQVG